jgi:hypothetical protein
MSDHKKHYWWERKYDWDRPVAWHPKLVAWALIVGERPRAGRPEDGRRPHRGLLPDVDFDRAVVDPGHRPLSRRIAGFLWGLIRPAEVALPAELAREVGESPAASYIGEDSTGAVAIRPEGGSTGKYDWLRAA